MSFSKQNCARPSCQRSHPYEPTRSDSALCVKGTGLDAFLSNWSSSLCFLCLSPPPWMQCTGTSDLQPSLDRARSASTNCLRPDASLHSPERERYKDFLNFLSFCTVIFFPITLFCVLESHGLFIHVHSPTVCISPPFCTRLCRDVCMWRSQREHIHTFP